MEESKLDRAKKKAKIVSQYQEVFNSPSGRAVLYDLMRGNFILWASPFVEGDEFATARNIGKQEVIKSILYILKLDAGDLLKLVGEYEEGNHV